jgi:hypothetical protein
MAEDEFPEPIYEIEADPSYLKTPAFKLLVLALLQAADEEIAREREAESERSVPKEAA